MNGIILAVDGLIGFGALASSWLWWLASCQRLRRISRLEERDAGDVNRIVTALNRTQILNARAALVASATAALAALSMAPAGMGRYLTAPVVDDEDIPKPPQVIANGSCLGASITQGFPTTPLDESAHERSQDLSGAIGDHAHRDR